MRLKRLEIAGFKSFMDRTSLAFETGVTAIVGPNGCGKSNIVDAIRWAMGEQSAKSLRGTGMEDVIFNGSDVHHPLGMAEVVLTFENHNGHTPAQLAHCAEIEVSRRLFRSGESEYAINRVPCRRRDVWELFMDTGLGNRSYAIVEQDRVSRIIHAKPEERRIVVEEVAGISKYKSRREAAQRKIDATRQNLLRIQDVRGEVGQQIQSLERQARKAERFRKLRNEILELERRIALRRWANLRGERSLLEEKGKRLEAERDRILTDLQVQEGTLEEDRLRILQLEKEVTEAQESLFRKESSVNDLEAQSRRNTQEVRSIEATGELLEKELILLTERIAAASQEAQRLDAQREGLEREKTEAGAKLEAAGARLRSVVEERQTLLARLEEAKTEVVERFSERAGLRNSIQHHQRNREEIARFLERHQEEEQELTRRIQSLGEGLEEAEQRIRQATEALAELEKERVRTSERTEELRAEQLEAQGVLEELRRELQETRSRLKTMEDLQREMEGFSEGVKGLRASSDRGEVLPGRPLRIVAELMEVSEGAETMVAGLLGERLQYVVVDDLEEAALALSHVREKALGRVGFVARDRGAGVDSSGKSPGSGLWERVQWEPGYEQLGEMLLGNVEVVADLPQALAAWRSNGHHCLLTEGGEVICPPGILEGGERKDPSAGYLSRKREIRALRGRASSLAQREQEARERAEELSGALLALAGERDRLTGEIHGGQMRQAEARRDLDSLRDSLRSASQRAEVLRWELEERGEELVRIRNAGDEETRRLEEVEAVIREGEARIAEMEKERQARNQGLDRLREELTRAQVEAASLGERCESVHREVGRLRERVAELSEEKDRKAKQRSEGASRADVLQEEIARTTEQLHGRIQEHHQARERLETVRRNLDEQRVRIQERERFNQQGRREAREIETELQRVLLQHRELVLRMEHMEGELAGRLELAVEEILAAAQALPSAGAETEHRQVDGLRQDLERLGDVNLAAAEQYEELKARYDLLTAQQEDLEESIRALQKAIQKINRTSRKRFREAFARLDAEFQKVFPMLFEGGEAHLVLTEAEDVLESGVEIVARPTGKRLQSISLLSGGEKALTAVALIFSMILIKRTPFCLFDEVDAPLDDANIDRFNGMIRDLSRDSQFILVTHSKRTMEMADALYGVTMEKPGVSKTLSVRLH